MPKLNYVIKVLIVSDAFFLSSLGLLNPIFAIFLTSQIKGGTIETAGIAATIYLIVRTIFLLPVSSQIDKQKGERDDLFFLVGGLLIMALTSVLYIFAGTATHIYILQIFLGLGAAMHYPAWYVLFTRHIGRFREGFAWGVYEVVIGLSGAIAALTGAFLAENYGFSLVFSLVAFLTFASALLPLSFYKHLKTRKQVEEEIKKHASSSLADYRPEGEIF